MSPLRKYFLRVARRWLLVVVLAAVGGGLSAVWLLQTARTTWTATAALTSQSQLRSPEQDGVLALGYVDYFNQESYQQLLRAKANIPEDVSLSAQTGASSPIIYVQAEGGSEEAVRDSATAAAEVFREDVRQSLVTERRQAADDLQAEIDKNTQILNDLTRTDVEKNVLLDQIRSLQGRVTEFLADNTNHLKQLQPEPSIASATPSPVTGTLAGTVGGAVLGVLIALLLAVFDRRLQGAAEVREAAGLPVLAELPRGQEAGIRTRNLLNSLTLDAGEATTVIAVVAPRRSRAVSALAYELVGAWSARRGGALHVLADLRDPQPEYGGTRGLVDVLEGRVSVFDAATRQADGLWVLPPGDLANADSYALTDRRILADAIEDASRAVRLVVLEAPPLLEAPESQTVCAAADRVILLVEESRTRSDDLAAATELLSAVKVPVSGVVLDKTHGERTDAARTAGAGQVAHEAGRPTPRGTNDVGVGPRTGLVGVARTGSVESNGSTDETWKG